MLKTANEVVDIAVKAAVAYRRDDLLHRLRGTQARLADRTIRVLVAGEFKQGKSALVNALVNAPVCPVDDDAAACMPIEIGYAETPTADHVEYPDPHSQEGRRHGIPIDGVRQHVRDTDATDRTVVRHVEVGIPRDILSGGLRLVDMPGSGGLGSLHGAGIVATLPSAHALIMVSDSSQEYTASELDFVCHAAQLCPTVLCVLTKIDLYPEWRRIAEIDRGRLRDAGVDARLLAVSSHLRTVALDRQDRQLNAESGFAALAHHLRDEVLANADRLACRSAAQDVLAVTKALHGSMSTELAALRDPAMTEALMAELAEATARADRLRKQSARWQQTLNDGVADLTADIDHDLRERMRAVLREAETELEAVDPTHVVDEFSAWLQRRVASAASANFVWTRQRVQWLASQVADHFGAEGVADLPTPEHTVAAGALAQAVEFSMPEAEKFGFGQKWISGMRGGYGGTLMVGMASTLAGLALINPLSIVAGVLLGRKTVKDERKRMLQRRQAEAKSATRRYVDDVLFQLGKESRALLRQAQRTLRDHFSHVAEELVRSLAESTQAAQQAVSLDRKDRERRIADLEAELARIDNLAGTARALASSGGAAPASEEGAR